VLQTIAAALGMDLQGVLAGDRFRLLTAAEMREITRHNIDLHLHTDSHRLPDSYETVAREIELNRAAVTAITGVPSRHFCYPSGEYTARHPQWLSALGIVSGTTCDPGLNSPGTSVMLLKRFLDSDDFSDISFEAEVCGVREIARRLRARLAGGNGRRAALTVPGSP
jgi:peptidoglycan/xylan/chitin deacetylase (PgdA/CDA1 family)